MKNLLKILLLATLFFTQTAEAASVVSYPRTILPRAHQTEWVGTTTQAWQGVYSKEYCLTGDTCITAWPTGSGSGGFDFLYNQNIGFGQTGSSTTTRTKFTNGIVASSTTAGQPSIRGETQRLSASSTPFLIFENNGTGATNANWNFRKGALANDDFDIYPSTRDSGDTFNIFSAVSVGKEGGSLGNGMLNGMLNFNTPDNFTGTTFNFMNENDDYTHTNGLPLYTFLNITGTVDLVGTTIGTATVFNFSKILSSSGANTGIVEATVFNSAPTIQSNGTARNDLGLVAFPGDYYSGTTFSAINSGSLTFDNEPWSGYMTRPIISAEPGSTVTVSEWRGFNCIDPAVGGGGTATLKKYNCLVIGNDDSGDGSASYYNGIYSDQIGGSFLFQEPSSTATSSINKLTVSQGTSTAQWHVGTLLTGNQFQMTRGTTTAELRVAKELSVGTLTKTDLFSTRRGTSTQEFNASTELKVGTVLKNANGATGTPAYTFTSDTNTGLFRPFADTLVFSTNGIARGLIGNTGTYLGTTTPQTNSFFVVGTSTALIHIGTNAKVGVLCPNGNSGRLSFGCGSNINVNPNVFGLFQHATDARFGASAADSGVFMKSSGGVYAFNYAGGVAKALVLQEFGSCVVAGTTACLASEKFYILGADNGIAQAIRINASSANVTTADTFIDFSSTDGSIGSIAGTAVAGTIIYNTFTGSHYTQIDDRSKLFDGALLCSTGELVNFKGKKGTFTEEYMTLENVKNSKGDIVGEKQVIKKRLRPFQKPVNPIHLTKSEVCDTKASKAVYGVYGGQDNQGRDTSLSLGTGLMWVTNTGQDLEVGDYLISSSRAGYAEKQGDDIYRNSTGAKIMINLKWKKGEKERYVPVIYEGG